MVRKRKDDTSTRGTVAAEAIPFSLVPVSSRLAKGNRAFRARVRSRGTLTQNDLAREMARHVGAGGVSTCAYYLALMQEVLADKTKAGYRIKTSLFETGVAIGGTFDSGDGEFDPSRHDVRPTICATKAFKAVLHGVVVRLVDWQGA